MDLGFHRLLHQMKARIYLYYEFPECLLRYGKMNKYSKRELRDYLKQQTSVRK